MTDEQPDIPWWQSWLDMDQLWLILAVLVVLSILALIVMVALLKHLFQLLRSGDRAARLAAEELRVDLSELPSHGPPAAGPQLECYGIPVRVAVLVLAPVGRHGKLPEPADVPSFLESLIPGLNNVIVAQRTMVKCWPPQLSSQGFTQSFFGLLALPGDRGKGTPWCSVAGKFDWSGQQYLAGLVLCAAAPNGLGQITVHQSGLWLDVLRVRKGERGA